MDEDLATYDHFNWWLPLCAVVGTLIAYLPITILPYDGGWLLYAFVITPLVCIVLVGIAIENRGGRRLAVVSMLAVYGILSWAILSNYLDARSEARWLLHSRQFKAELLAQPTWPNGELRHIEWDGWGFAGMDTEVYLVSDPSNLLSAATKSHVPGKVNGLPCDVVQVHRLESRWYFVLFYTDTSWNHCSP
jgi:hypothetical protein